MNKTLTSGYFLLFQKCRSIGSVLCLIFIKADRELKRVSQFVFLVLGKGFHKLDHLISEKSAILTWEFVKTLFKVRLINVFVLLV